MPSPGEDYQSWSPTAIDNGSADPLITWVEGQPRASVNNSSRSEMAAHAKHRNLINGSIITTGTINAQEFLSGLTYTAIPTGLVIKLKIGAGLTNTASTTLNMDGIGATLIQTATGENLRGGELIAGSYTDFLYNGTNWIFLYSHEFFQAEISGGGGIIIGQQIFSTAGTFLYTPTPGTDCCIIECVGGGGGGGGATADIVMTYQGGGGGSGGYSRKLATAADLGASQVVTVGAGGLGGSIPLHSGAGLPGGTTSLGSLCVANGGEGGGYANPNLNPHGGAGGVAGIGDVACPGTTGGWGMMNGDGVNTIHTYILSGDGAPGFFGGGVGGNAGIYGNTATGFGSGGAGGHAYNSTIAVMGGGNGASGVVIVTEFGGRGSPGRDGATGAPGPVGPAGPAGAGTGDVLVSGTPVAGQYAQWTDTSHITGITAPLPTTGDVKLTFKTIADSGWIILNDGSIGDATSGATTRANNDTLDLFTLFWNNIDSLVLQDSSGATVARGVNASTDFIAHRRIVLPKALGHALGVAGAGSGMTARALGTTTGSETMTLVEAHLASHFHGFVASRGNATYFLQSGGTGISMGDTISTGSTSSAGSGVPFSIMQPTSFFNVMVKL